ncbi:MAG TPA: hypothetical protein VHE13_08065 [Opitutus sp.]|nr:hypothetical protein [Opitutus sp.]
MAAPELIEIDWPEFGIAAPVPGPTADELERRIAATRAAIERRELSHLVVYGDREHFANLAWLTNLDPRFEEMVLVLRPDAPPLLIVGNECEGYLPFSPLHSGGRLRHERFPTFSLLDQPRTGGRALREIFAGEGIAGGARVGCAGWKYFSAAEDPAGRLALEVPSFIADALRELAGREQVENATDLFMHPGHGLRATASVAEIARFEYVNAKAAEGVRRMLFHVRPGLRDHDVFRAAEWDGEPLGCHATFASGDQPGLAGPTGRVLRRGEPLSLNLCYWGGNICRAGWIAEAADDLPANARDYVAVFAGPYFEAMGEWFGRLRIGTPGGELHALIAQRLPFERFGVFLNPGHLIHFDEWLSSPIYADSKVPLRSGMVMQVDVIPSSPVYGSTRMEDGVVLADRGLREELHQRFPECYARCRARRAFMGNALGIGLPDEVLPLSNMPAIVPPFFLRPERVLALKR